MIKMFIILSMGLTILSGCAETEVIVEHVIEDITEEVAEEIAKDKLEKNSQ